MLTAIVPAAGLGTRMKSAENKQFINIAGQPLLARTLLSLEGLADRYVVVARAGEERRYRDLVAHLSLDAVVVTGGETRQQSVYAGLEAAGESQWILIHDGCRPFAPRELIEQLIAVARKTGAAIPVLPLVDTVKEIRGGVVVSTPDRRCLRAVQTPQVFRWDVIWQAHCQAREQGLESTDDAALVEATGAAVSVVEGSPENVKITTPLDLEKAKRPGFRVGTGFDAHGLVGGRPLIIGGMEIPHTQGLDGHSDADVLVHAIIDALLGAAALGDLGAHFPDTDNQYKNISSLTLLARARELLETKGYCIVNIDATVIAQRPKLAAHIPKMRGKIADVLGIEHADISIKATTTEGMGFTGREEGIAAQAACLIQVLKEVD